MTSVLASFWRRFRGLAGWAQATIALGVTLVLVSPYMSAAEPATTANRSQTTVTTADPTTVGEVISAGVTTVATTTTVALVPTSVVPAGVPAGGDDTSVERVIDGDTIVVAGGTRVRLIGIDTPETVDPSSPVQCFGPEASRYATQLLPVGSPVRLVYDIERLDRYGRTLAYVYKLTDGVFVNLAIARNGFATQLTVPPNVAHAEEFRAAAAQARTADLGLWRVCRSTTTLTAPVYVAPTTLATVAPTTLTTAASGGCHPSYTGACVPTGFSDVDCAGGSGNGPGYVSAKNFRVVGPDVYGLDADGDGIACESR